MLVESMMNLDHSQFDEPACAFLFLNLTWPIKKVTNMQIDLMLVRILLDTGTPSVNTEPTCQILYLLVSFPAGDADFSPCNESESDGEDQLLRCESQDIFGPNFQDGETVDG